MCNQKDFSGVWIYVVLFLSLCKEAYRFKYFSRKHLMDTKSSGKQGNAGNQIMFDINATLFYVPSMYTYIFVHLSFPVSILYFQKCLGGTLFLLKYVPIHTWELFKIFIRKLHKAKKVSFYTNASLCLNSDISFSQLPKILLNSLSVWSDKIIDLLFLRYLGQQIKWCSCFTNTIKYQAFFGLKQIFNW